MTPATPTDLNLSILRDALADAQATVRSYVTKAQIVGVGYFFALGVVGRLSDQLSTGREIGVLEVLLGWAGVILPILLFGYVL